MRSLADDYKESHSSNHETIADLMFCALVMLILFVLALSIEVSQRVRSNEVAATPVIETPAKAIDAMTPEQLKTLTAKLVSQSREVDSLKLQLKQEREKVGNQMASLAGEQRFTGAREPAAFSMAYDYDRELYYFAPSKDVEEADRRLSGESIFDHSIRKKVQLTQMAVKLRASRGYTEAEVKAIYQALTQYSEVTEGPLGYYLQQTEVELYYHTYLSELIAGDIESSVDHDDVVTRAILLMGRETGPPSDQMYPSCKCIVSNASETVTVGGIRLAPKDLLGILLSVSGRGVMLDFEGYSGKPPGWLHGQVLMPAGYISKTPKLPK